jgi:hypothetical protein
VWKRVERKEVEVRVVTRVCNGQNEVVGEHELRIMLFGMRVEVRVWIRARSAQSFELFQPRSLLIRPNIGLCSENMANYEE